MQLVAQIVKAGADAFGRIGLYLSLFQNEKQLTRCAADVLVSNAGICPFADFLTMPHSTWERTRQVNLDGSFYIVQGKISTRYFLGMYCHILGSCGKPNEKPDTARRFYHWHLIHICTRRR